MLTEQQQNTVDRDERSLAIAHTICHQLGGQGRLKCMIGAKAFAVVENGLSFKFPREGPDGYKVNYVKITLNGLDLYDVEFGYIHGGNYKVVTKHENAYCDSLEDLFYNATGLYLSL